MKPIALHVASEVAPFHKAGGLGDVLSGLPPALDRAGVDVRIVTPRYGVSKFASVGGLGALHPWPLPLDLAVGGQNVRARVLEAKTHGGTATTYFVEAIHLSRGELYGYGDDAYRFAILCKASIAIASVLARSKGTGPIGVLHAHDWHAALAMHYARSESSAIRHVPTVFTIHNLAYQGELQASNTPYLDVGWGDYHRYFESHGALNLMKGALLIADRVTTVSPNYAREIQSHEYGQGLDGLLRHIAFKLSGIANGIDTKSWNPATDPKLPVHFTADDPEARELGRAALRWELGLAHGGREDPPILGVVSRFTHQKGIDLIADVADAYVRGGGQIVALGEGDEQLEARLHYLGLAHPGRIAYRRAFDDGLARRIYGASDLFAMPSRFEPCGLAQLYAMRYGSIPVARATGGLVDTVHRLHNQHEVGGATGILYEGGEDDSVALLRALEWGRAVVRDRSALELIRRNAMQANHSWDHRALAYVDLYRSIGMPI
jgi:starch synthase